MNSQEITKAIGAHGMWKRRLQNVIDQGTADVSPQQVAPDNLCEFGRWLYSLPLEARRSPEFSKVQALHASFHKEAARVLSLAISGNRSGAQKSLDDGGAYASVSIELTSAMIAWKKKIEDSSGGANRAAA